MPPPRPRPLPPPGMPPISPKMAAKGSCPPNICAKSASAWSRENAVPPAIPGPPFRPCFPT
eukprot:scaffold163189_cov30-Tisochrysis_lutea.AAC.2